MSVSNTGGSPSSGAGLQSGSRPLSPISRKSSLGVGATVGKKNQMDTVILPLCPKGAVDFAKINPCRKRKDQLSKNYKPRKKTVFRVPLKKEDGNMEAQIVEYNCEFPNRVVVRMEYLMQSTKVRLNDRHYMDDLYIKLLEEESRDMEKATKSREKAELNRMKKLIIDGINLDIPPELWYLHRHPVFRVNKMLLRLNLYDTGFMMTKTSEDDEMTPVEPYEFDGNQFFKHLHEEGVVWMPPYFEEYEREKMNGKIYRAKLRVMIKRKEQEAEDLISEMMNEEPTAPHTEVIFAAPGKVDWNKQNQSKLSTPGFVIEEEMRELEAEDQELSGALHLKGGTISKPLSTQSIAISRIRERTKLDVMNIQEKIKRSKDQQARRDDDLDLKRRELEDGYVERYDYDFHRMLSRHKEREQNKNLETMLERVAEDPDGPTVPSRTGSKKMKPFETMFEKEVATDDEDVKVTDKNLLSKLKAFYRVPKGENFNNYKTFEDKFLEPLDTYDEGHEMIDYAQEVVNMYWREELVATDYGQKPLPEFEREPEKPKPKRKSSSKKKKSTSTKGSVSKAEKGSKEEKISKEGRISKAGRGSNEQRGSMGARSSMEARSNEEKGSMEDRGSFDPTQERFSTDSPTGDWNFMDLEDPEPDLE